MAKLGVEPSRYIGKNFAEFFGAMKYFSGKSQSEMAAGINVSLSTFSLWMKGWSIPSPIRIGQIQEAFGLSKDEVLRLRDESRLARHRETQTNIDLPEASREQLLGAFAVRIARGEPPLTEIEADLLRFLIEPEEK